MQVREEGIERVKGANGLAAVMAERGIELRKKGRVLVAGALSTKRGRPPSRSRRGRVSTTALGAAQTVTSSARDEARQGELWGCSRGLARHAGLDLGQLMEGRPRIRQRTPLAALTPPRNGKTASVSTPRPRARPTWRPAGAPRLWSFPWWWSTPTGPRARGRTRRRTWRSAASRTGSSAGGEGRLCGRIPPEDCPRHGELRDELLSSASSPPRGALLGGCVVVPILDPVWASGRTSTAGG